MPSTAEPRPARPILRTRAYLIALLVAAILLFAIGFLPQFGGPGYEAALAAGLILPSTLAIASALDVAGSALQPIEALGRSIAAAALFVAAALLLLLVHGVRVGFCDAWWGIWLFALGSGFGALMGAAWGSVAGLVAARLLGRGRRRTIACVLLGLCGPLATIAVSLWRFYTSPMVFAFDPFFGYFSGPLYDTVIDPIWGLLTYRVGSLFSLAALAVAMFHLVRRPTNQLVWSWRAHPVLAGGGICAAAASVAITLSGPTLGHYSTTSSIEAALGRRLAEGRCDVIYSSSVIERDARLLAGDCMAHLKQIERFFGSSGPSRLRVFLFASDAEKGRLMGASNTYIAKPWRGEVYVQASAYPHPVLGHEIAHVVAGSFGQGPFRVAGPLIGWIPDPGRIEGIAVAASPSEADEFSLDEWSRALMDLKLLPPLSSVFKLSFLGQNSSTAYTVAGSFVRWFRERYGAPALKRWYAGEALERLSGGKDLSKLEAEWHAMLRATSIDPMLLHAARVRFDRPALFGRRCPRIVDRLYGVASARLGAGDAKGAREAFDELLDLDAQHVGARLGVAACALRAGNEAVAVQRYTALSTSKDFSKLEQANAREAIGDIHLLFRRSEQARAAYEAVAEIAADEDRLRTLDVKRLPQTELEREAVVALLIGDPLLGQSWDVAAPKLAEWATHEPEQGIAEYLLGKNLLGHGRFQEAAMYLDRALAKRIDLPRVLREALRSRLIAACALHDHANAERAYRSLLDAPGLSPARSLAVTRFAERCAIDSQTLHGHGAQ